MLVGNKLPTLIALFSRVESAISNLPARIFMAKERKDQGCGYCREYWQKYDYRLTLLKDSAVMQSRLYRCPECTWYWEEDLRFVCVITEAEAKRSYGL